VFPIYDWKRILFTFLNEEESAMYLTKSIIMLYTVLLTTVAFASSLPDRSWTTSESKYGIVVWVEVVPDGSPVKFILEGAGVLDCQDTFTLNNPDKSTIKTLHKLEEQGMSVRVFYYPDCSIQGIGYKKKEVPEPKKS